MGWDWLPRATSATMPTQGVDSLALVLSVCQYVLPLDQLQPRRVCIVKPSALGDVVQSLPVLAALKDRWPAARFSWVIHRGLAGLLAGHPDLDEVIHFDRGARGLAQLRASYSLGCTLRRTRFDLVIDLQGLLRSGLMTAVTRAPRRMGFASAREGADWFYTERVETPPGVTAAVERYWQFAQALGCTGEPPAARLGITAEHVAWAKSQLAGLPRPILAIHPGAQWRTKRWPPASFAAVAQRAHREFGASLVLVCGPGEQTLCGEVARLAAVPTVNLAGRTSLLQLAALSREVDLFLSGDTGPLHLAAAVGAPVVGLYTCSSPARARPHGVGHRVVATQVSCAASYLKTCTRLACMDELSPVRVSPAVAAGLNDASRRRRAG